VERRGWSQKLRKPQLLRPKRPGSLAEKRSASTDDWRSVFKIKSNLVYEGTFGFSEKENYECTNCWECWALLRLL